MTRKYKINNIDDLRKKAEHNLQYEKIPVNQMSEESILKTIHELHVHQIELKMQNDELQRMQAEMEKSRSKYSDLYDFAPIGYFILDKKGMILEVNITGASMVGIERNFLLNQPFILHICKEDRDNFYQNHLHVFKSNVSKCYNIKMLRKRNDEFFVELRVDPVINDSGEVTHCRIAAIDTTERIKADQLIRLEKNKEQKYLDVAGVIIVALDLEGRVSLINRKGCEILKYKEEEILGRNWINNFLPMRIRDDIREILGKLLQGEHDTRTYRENPVLTKSGEERLIAWHNTVLRDEKGDVLAILSSGQDITEQKKTQEQIVELARFTTENPSPVLRISKDGIVMYANKASSLLLKCWGCGVGRSLPEHWKKIAINTLSTGQNREIEAKCDSQIFSLTFTPVMDYSYINAYGLDITERKKAEEALRQEHNLLRLLIDNIPDRIYVKDNKHRFILGNETIVRHEGLQCEKELIGKTDFDLYPEEIANDFYAEEQKIIQRCRRLINYERSYFDKQNNERWTLTTKVPLQDEKGNVIGIVGINRDITERKEADKAIRESENKYRELANSITDVFFAMDTDLKYTYWNKASEEITGIKAENTLGKTIFEIFPDTEDTMETAAVYQDVLKRKQSRSFESEFQSKNKHCFFEVNVYPNEYGISVFAKDITDRKLAEEALRESEELNRVTMENILDPVFITDDAGRFTFICANVLYTIGYSIEELQAMGNISRLAGEDLFNLEELETRRVIRNIERAIMDKQGRDRDYVISVKHVSIKGGTILYTFQDITDRKKAEKQLVENQAKLKAMASKILMAEEYERRRLAVGLHDDICQKLVFAKFAMESSLKLISDSKVLTSLRSACEQIGETIQDAESMTFELSNPILREFGFIAALEKYLNEEIRQKHGIEYEFDKGTRIGALQDEIKTCLFRVTRELLTNVIKHARAKKVKVSVRRNRDKLNLSVQDDGIGFDTGISNEVSTTRFGLFSVREQLEYIGGYLGIESESGHGTTINVSVPLRKKSSNTNSMGL
jgi:PAS domain S-box-containing protein